MASKSVRKVFATAMTPTNYALKLRAHGRWMLQEWSARRERSSNGGAHKWDEDADDWLIRNIYDLVRHFLSAGERRQFLDWAKATGVTYEGGGDISDHPYKMALLVFAGQAANGTKAPFTRQRRHLLGNAFAYAHLHDVRAKHVIGFIKQSKVKECGKKLAAGHREPGFDRKREPSLTSALLCNPTE